MDLYNPSDKSHLQPLDKSVNYIQSELKNGRSLVAGVHYGGVSDQNKNNYTNHFVNIVGMGFKMENNQPVNYFRYQDTARSHISLNSTPLNIFTLGDYNGVAAYRADVGYRGVTNDEGKPMTYILTEIRINQ